ncbi:MAG: lipoyl synthase [Gammaproteobacteria bacterium]|nr:lipoyl synthase [Gammaproteobacteria bacterium]
MSPTNKQRGEDKVSRIPIKIVPSETILRKPEWIRIKVTNSESVTALKKTIKDNGLYTVCEEASCPNLNECYGHGTATFMILGDLCTRRCPFCDVAHGRPLPPDDHEPVKLAETIQLMNLKYVVITSVDRDDLKDGGASHFQQCIKQVRIVNPSIKIEVLVPDFRGRMEKALSALQPSLPDVFNHNLETVPRLYKQARPGSDYQWSLKLIQEFKQANPCIPTKSGMMLGLGEELDEVREVMRDLRSHDCDMLTLGQYLQPSKHHLPVIRYVTPAEFNQLRDDALKMGFSNVASGPMVRSSYHADQQAAGGN